MVLVLAGLLTPLAWSQDADIFMLLGRAEVAPTRQGPWTPATQGQKLAAGSFIRTLEGGQVALLLRDQTQVRMNQSSLLEIQAIQDGSGVTSMSLLQGRVWAQVKQLTVGALRTISTAVRPVQVRISTPTATIGIRGTDWELSIGDQDATTVTVLSGQVEMSNELGQVAVGPNEQAVAERGKAPVKSILSNARDRVQWVTAYRPAPSRWVPAPPEALRPAVRAAEAGDYTQARAQLESAPASYPRAMLLADLYLFLGRADDATKLLQPYAQAGQGEAGASALSSRALVIAGRLDDAQKLLDTALARHPGDAELLLALGDLARLQGDAEAALGWFTRVTREHPARHEGWFGVGRIQVERENVKPARQALDEAIRLAPNGLGYLGERATLLALAGDPAEARAAFDQALKQQPDDYLALTGLGILQLKSGDTSAALESFLKAGTIEPRFARAQLYVGVAYYRLGNRPRAIESLRKSAELDAKDPLPWVMLGLIHGDDQELAAAVDAAIEAQARMPFLKSLNQLLNNQKGSANVGAALAARGMDEWGRAYATDSYNPYWGGSALFLADRYTDGFNKNSELYKGYLLDPVAFGASNRFSSLVPTPGHYGGISLRAESGDFNQVSLVGSANGLSSGATPIAYSLVADLADGRASPNTFQANGGNLTLGLGAKPSHELGLFYFGTRTGVDGRFTDPPSPTGSALTDATLDVTTWRQDLGLGYRLGAANQLFFKLGDGDQKARLRGNLFNVSQATALDTALAGIPVLLPFSPAAQLDNYATNIGQTDYQFRHAFEVARGVNLAWGLEFGKERRTLNFVRTFESAFSPLFPAQISSDASRKFASSDLYVSGRGKLSESLDLQLDLVHQRFQSTTRLLDNIDLVGIGNLSSTNTVEREDFARINPRLGARLSLGEGRQLRAVHQQWRRPVGIATLGAVDTVGVPVEDRLVDVGGLLKRTRLQYDAQIGSEGFLQFHLDHKDVRNLQSATTPLFAVFGVTELDALRARKPVFGQSFDELEDTPVFVQGKVSTLGVAANWQINREVSLATRYTLAHSQNTGPGLATARVPLIPRHFFNASLFWQGGARWLVAASATYRSSRFTDEANTKPLGAGWAFGVSSFWETDDKRWTVEAGLTNLAPSKSAVIQRKPKALLNASYRF